MEIERLGAMEIERIGTDAIRIAPGRRPVDPDRVKALAESIKKIGLQTPVTVWIETDGEQDIPHLVAGAHRVAACKMLDIDVDAFVTTADEIDRDLWEIDENLCRSELTEAQEVAYIARRKELWQAQNERDAANIVQTSDKTSGRPKTGDFARETAAVTGQSKSTIAAKVARAEAIAPDVLKDIQGTRWDRGTNLDVLKRLTHAEQRQALFRVKNGVDATFDAAFDFIRGEPAAPQRKPVQPPGRALNDMEVFNQQLARLVSAWNGASREARQAFVEQYVDTPIMDRSA